MFEVPAVDFISSWGVVDFVLFIVSWTCVVLSVIVVVSTLCVFFSMCLFVFYDLCLTVLWNCWLNASAICVSEVIVLSLKIFVLCVGCVFVVVG